MNGTSPSQSRQTPILYWNRGQLRVEEEKVYGADWISRLYGTWLGKKVTESILVKHYPSKLYGYLQSSILSRSKIAEFIRQYDIDMREFEARPFQSFNDFFTRKFIEGARPFILDEDVLPAFAEARYLGFDKIRNDQRFPVKGEHLTAQALLHNREVSKWFEGGPLLIARLCPVDYHRFHFPDDGRAKLNYRIPGDLDSVNPWALQAKSKIFSRNERHVTLLETEHFGKLAYVEVGAMMVGKIKQTHPSVKTKTEGGFQRGDEKGYFLFGASTVILMGEPGRWAPSEDILEYSARKMEVFVKLGDEVGRLNS